jgi:beta-lactamase class A
MTKVTRRACLQTVLPAAAGWCIGGRIAVAAPMEESWFAAQISELEQRSGGRLGVALLDTDSGAHASHRGDERFPMCSTHKMISAAAVLARVEAGKETLDRVVRVAKTDLVGYSPVTEKHVDGAGMTMSELCEAAVTMSDNGAANLLLASMGGPAGWTAYVRSLGDAMTRLDRNEPGLNECAPGDPRDTTTPEAMVADLRALTLGNALSAASRDRLTGWLKECKTGSQRLHAGIPPDWQEGDKTGTGNNGTGTSNDVAILWPPRRKPVLVAAFLTRSTLDDAGREGILAEVGKAVAKMVQRG